MSPVVAKAIEQMMAEQGDKFSLEKVNLAELKRRTGISRARLRRMKEHGFEDTEHAAKGRKASTTLLSGYTGILDGLLKNGVTNSAVCLSRLRANGYTGSQTTIKNYILAHQHLIPPARYAVAPQGNRGRRYTTGPGDAFQMDWGFTKVQSFTGEEYSVACFAMVCHHCGERYVEFFPNAKQENLFIGMLHGFRYMGVPQYILTDNMKSVVIKMLLFLSFALPLLLTGCGAGNQTIGLAVRGSDFRVVNKEGETVNYSSGEFSGTMDLIHQQAANDVGAEDRYLLEVSRSDHFTYQCDGSGGQLFGIVTDPDLNISEPDYSEYTVRGMGMETITVTPDGEMSFTGNDMAVETAFSMPCASLGEHGFVRFSGSADSNASVSVDAETGRILFSGISPGSSALSYAGTVSNSWVTIELSVGTGSIDLSKLGEGQIIIAEDGCEEQIIEA